MGSPCLLGSGAPLTIIQRIQMQNDEVMKKYYSDEAQKLLAERVHLWSPELQALLVRVVDADGHGLQHWKDQQIQVEVTPSTGAVVESWGGSTNVGSDGTFFFAGVHPGTYIVSVPNSPEQKRIFVAPRQQAEVVLELR